MFGFHEFRMYELFSRNFSGFLLKKGRIFLLRSKMLLKLFIFTKKRHFAAPLKESKTFFVKKNSGFVDSEFVQLCLGQTSAGY